MKITYEELQKKCVLLAEQVSKSFKPDVVVSMTRGGLLSAYFIADILGVKSIESINISHGENEEFTDETKFKKDFSNLNALIVDDLIDSGHALSYIFSNYKFNPAKTKIAVIYYRDGSKFNADFFVERIQDDRIIFPYERGKKNDE